MTFEKVGHVALSGSAVLHMAVEVGKRSYSHIMVMVEKLHQ